ncbi:MAG: deoxyribodipyrimidine photo-lyase [Nocardioidaceae bacterium]|nr:deoxyribodipyrimidine photo-lyase [Nocardioidaceae bacterium]
MPTSVMWFRRDLRLADNPALVEAAQGGIILPLFVVDPRLWEPAGPSRRAYLLASLESLADQTGGLVLRAGDPVEVVPQVVREAGADSVHIAADFGPYGAERDRCVERALADTGVRLVRTGSPYAVAPGRVRNKTGDSYQVFSPFSKAWRDHGWRAPAATPRTLTWDVSLRNDAMPTVDLPAGLSLPDAGEESARRHWQAFVADRLGAYGTVRNRPDLDATSHMSVHLKWGEIHPRTMLADLETADASQRSILAYRTELAWREFYADVLARRPDSAREHYRPDFARMTYDEPGDALEAWKEGRTGFPIVDAGMRQLRAEGWMHNRVRMIVASFLVKDLHLEWQHGARHFSQWLVDGDLASNSHGWQWTAGSGTDAAPYFRVFNPIDQGKKFDPDGDYIRRYVPELSGVPAPEVHQPRAPIVDHAEERREALARYELIRGDGRTSR